MKGMKIVIDGRWVKQTGIGRYVERTTEELLKLDKQNDYVFLIRDKERKKYSLDSYKNVKMVTANYRWFTFGEQLGLLKIINSLKPDLVHFPNFAYPVLYTRKFVLTVHDLTLFEYKTINSSRNTRLVYEIKHLAMRFAFWMGAHRAKFVIVPTEFVKRQIVKKYRLNPERVCVTHEASDGRLAATGKIDLKKFSITKPFLLCVGNAYPHKNLERLVEAFAKIVDEHKLDIQLVIAGKKDVFHERVEAEVVKDKLEDRVVFTDYVTDAELAGLYEKAELYVFPSLSEGFGLPGLEAMAYGLPVVSSNATCLPEVYGDAAEYFDPLSVDDMASVIAKLYNDKKRQAELIKSGKEQIKKFSWEETARKTLAVYKKVLGQD